MKLIVLSLTLLFGLCSCQTTGPSVIEDKNAKVSEVNPAGETAEREYYVPTAPILPEPAAPKGQKAVKGNKLK